MESELSPGTSAGSAFVVVTPATSALVAAAVAGLVFAGACGGEDDACPSAGGASGTGTTAASGGGGSHAGGGEKVVTSEVEDTSMRYQKFYDLCVERGGMVQTHAVCAGVNACKGMSYNKYDYILMEHTCKAMNSCGGMSCVELPADSGKTGEQIYKDSCEGCHLPTADGGFKLFVPPGTDLDQAAEDLSTTPREALLAAAAFGIFTRNSNGVSGAHMPAYHERYARAELTRVIDYSLTLPVTAEEYGVLGVNEDIVPP